MRLFIAAILMAGMFVSCSKENQHERWLEDRWYHYTMHETWIDQNGDSFDTTYTVKDGSYIEFNQGKVYSYEAESDTTFTADYEYNFEDQLIVSEGDTIWVLSITRNEMELQQTQELFGFSITAAVELDTRKP